MQFHKFPGNKVSVSWEHVEEVEEEVDRFINIKKRARDFTRFWKQEDFPTVFTLLKK